MTPYVVSTAVSPFSRRAPESLFELADQAVAQALSDAGLAASEVDEVFIGSGAGRPTIGAKLMEYLGFVGLPVTRVEQACASGSTALRLALDAVEHGTRRHVLVIGLDELRQGVLDLSSPDDIEALLGLNLLPAYFAMKADQYLHKHGLKVEELARVAVKAKLSALSNPNAAYGGSFTIEDIESSTSIADPLTKLHCCGNASGAAAAVVSNRNSSDGAVRALAWRQAFTAADPTKLPDGGRDDLERTVEMLAASVYAEAGIQSADVEVVQVNDAFTVCGPLYLEALGLAAHGEGIGVFEGSSKPKVNTDGGLLGRGHCLGATGLAMVHEVRGRIAEGIGADLGLVQSHGLGADLIFCLASA